jgi:hypothetical protein
MCPFCEHIFLTIDEAADLLRVRRRTLDNLRWHGEGPSFRRHGGRIVYHRDEILAWSEQRRARLADVAVKSAPAQCHAGNAVPLAADVRAPIGRPALAVERQR